MTILINESGKDVNKKQLHIALDLCTNEGLYFFLILAGHIHGFFLPDLYKFRISITCRAGADFFI